MIYVLKSVYTNRIEIVDNLDDAQERLNELNKSVTLYKLKKYDLEPFRNLDEEREWLGGLKKIIEH